MFSKILIANRGEISCRISRTAHRLGLRTVAVYSDVDAGALHVQVADEAVRLGPAPSRESYLRADRLIAAARDCGAEAIHPGYGFLSENAEFSRACLAAGLVFIGPSPDAITAMGSKSGAKALMEKAGVPLIPGYHGDNQDEAHLLTQARTMGFPVLLKASAGGGGKGMRAVHEEREFLEALHAAQRESLNAFGDARMLIEKLLVEPRHVEVQVLADRHGNVVYVFDRDCSIQRRHQKVVEEAPAPGLSDALRQAMGEAAVRAARAIAYEGAGTLEFLVDRDGHFYFMEMNTRLQVEHPVTELIAGLDLVELQLRIASGEPLPFSQADLRPRGHAIEVRLYAEDPRKDFLPSTGTLRIFDLPTPEGVRVDTGYRAGDAVSVHYDPMMAKVIAWGETREIAAQRLQQALGGVRVAGVRHNAHFLVQVLGHRAFLRGELGTHFIAQHQGELLPTLPAPLPDLLLLAAQLLLQEALPATGSPSDPWSALQGFRLGVPDTVDLHLSLGETVHQVGLTPRSDGFDYTLAGAAGHCALRALGGDRWQLVRDERSHAYSALRRGDSVLVFVEGDTLELTRAPRHAVQAAGADEHHYRAPMNGRIVSVNVKAGDHVSQGDTLLVMEAMKMEHRIRAHAEGVVAAVAVAAGDLVSEGQTLVDL